MRNIGANEPRKSARLLLTMKNQEVTILDLAADYDMFRMKEKPRKIRAGLIARRGCVGD